MWDRLAAAVDALNARIGRVVAWLCLLMVAVGAFNAVARYVGRFVGANLSSNAYIELQWYLFSLVFLLGAAHTLKRDAHVRVDVLYSRLPRRARAWIDVIGTVVFLVPFCVFVIVVSWPAVHNSWIVLEGSPDPGGLPRFPLKTVIPVAFALLILQGLAMLVERLRTARGIGSDSAPPARAADPGDGRGGPEGDDGDGAQPVREPRGGHL
jgi:TRAP-type mannitol/chloroaromatic compound transport system permease small subunit